MTQPLQIAVVTETWPPEINGVAMTIARLVTGLRQRQHRVQIVRPRQPDESAERDDLLVRGLPLPGYPHLQFGLPATARLFLHWQAHRPDVVHIATEGPLGWSALRAAKRLGLPVTSSYHTHFDGYSRHYHASLLGPLVRAWLLRFHRRTQLTMVPTRHLADSLRTSGIAGACQLGRGVDTELFTPQRRSPALRATWGANEDGLVALYVGRLAPEKNLHLAARTFETIRANHPTARMVWVGDGPSRADLAKRHAGHVFAGARHGEDLAAHYASADLFLFPSLTETYGNVVAEAMASGLAVAAYHDAAAAELIDNGIHGLTAPAGQPHAFIDAACRLADEPDLLQRCRQAAPARVEPLRWDSVITRFEQLLHSAAAQTLKISSRGSKRARFAG